MISRAIVVGRRAWKCQMSNSVFYASTANTTGDKVRPAGRRTQYFLLIFTKPGRSLLAEPCTSQLGPGGGLNSFRASASEVRSPIYCVSVCLDRSERRDREEESGLYRCGLRTDGRWPRFCAHRKSNQRRPGGFCQRGLKRRRDSGAGTKTRKAICPHTTATRVPTRWL